jgi:hypothetical protein
MPSTTARIAINFFIFFSFLAACRRQMAMPHISNPIKVSYSGEHP